MRRWKWRLVALVLVGALGQTAAGRVQAQSAEVDTQVDVPGLIDEASAAYGVSAVQMRRISWCESRWFPGAYNRSSGASGLFQFIPRTWRWASAQAGYGGHSPFEAEANVFSAAWLLRYGGAQHWVCR